MFRRLAAFLGGFDLDAAQAVAGGGDMPRYQVLDLLTLLVDKSLVVADDSRGRTRYRLLETVRQYAAEKLGESGEADDVRTRHRDHYTSMAALLDGPASSDYGQRVEQTEAEIDNMRAAFAWSRENGDAERALALASSLSPLWQPRPAEGVAWLDVVLDEADAQHLDIAPAVRARALADRVLLAANIGWYADLPGQADEALTIARQLDDPALLTRVLAARGLIGFGSAEAQEYFAEAIALARKLGDRLRLSHILSVETLVASFTGDVIAKRAAAQEGCELAEAIGYRAGFVRCRWCLGLAQLAQGDCAGAVAQFRTAGAAAEAGHYANFQKYALAFQGVALAWQGEADAARAAASEASRAATTSLAPHRQCCLFALGNAALAAGDVGTARDATAAAWEHGSVSPAYAALLRPFIAQAALAGGDLVAARRWADEAVATATGWTRMWALTTRARVAIAQGEPDQAERDAHDALACAAEVEAYLVVPDILECLAALAGEAGSHREAARLFGAADAIRQRMGSVRFKI